MTDSHERGTSAHSIPDGSKTGHRHDGEPLATSKVTDDTEGPSGLPDGTYDGKYRLTEFAERRLDEAERLLEDPDVQGFTDVDELLRHLGLR